MSLEEHRCSVCRQINEHSTPWLVAISNPDLAGLIIQPAETITEPRNPELTYENICGESCAHKRLSRWFTSLLSHSESEMA